MSRFFVQKYFAEYYVLTVWVCNFLAKKIGAKAACKLLVKLTTGGFFLKKEPSGHSFLLKHFLDTLSITGPCNTCTNGPYQL